MGIKRMPIWTLVAIWTRRLVRGLWLIEGVIALKEFSIINNLEPVAKHNLPFGGLRSTT
jgi:hypothetical protein